MDEPLEDIRGYTEPRLRPSGSYIDSLAPSGPIDPVRLDGHITEMQKILAELNTSLVGFLACKVTRNELDNRTNNAAQVLQLLSNKLPTRR